MDEETLERIGLTPGEAKTYLALLEIGQEPTGPIVERSGVSTSKTYKILRRLESKGLASHIQRNGVLHWSATTPERILDLLDEEQEQLQQRRQAAQKAIPELLQKINNLREAQQAEVHVGRKAQHALLAEQLRHGEANPKEVQLSIGSAEHYGAWQTRFWGIHEQKKNAMHIRRRYLFGEQTQGTFPEVETSRFVDVRYLPYNSPVSMEIYGKNTVIMFLIEDPVFFVLRSQPVADSMRQQFEVLWKAASPKKTRR